MLNFVSAKDYLPILPDMMGLDNMYLIKLVFDVTKTDDLMR